MNIYESSEDYLEAILIIQEKKGFCRSIDICSELGFTKPSVSIAMRKLKESGLIEVKEHGHIELTKEGQAIADKVYERHIVLTEALVSLGVDEEQAKIDACKIEHDLSNDSFQAIKKHFE